MEKPEGVDGEIFTLFKEFVEGLPYLLGDATGDWIDTWNCWYAGYLTAIKVNGGD